MRGQTEIRVVVSFVADEVTEEIAVNNLKRSVAARHREMKTTRILLADKTTALCEIAARLQSVITRFFAGTCTLRSAESLEPIKHWHPDLVLLDPSANEKVEAESPPPSASPHGDSRVVILALSYEQEQGAKRRSRHGLRRRQKKTWHLICASAQAIDLDGLSRSNRAVVPREIQTLLE